MDSKYAMARMFRKVTGCSKARGGCQGVNGLCASPRIAVVGFGFRDFQLVHGRLSAGFGSDT
ncbi:MAG: hypothetical protein CMJ21_06925 [Phycisphaerae bacterium]|nr:hypothetical protein [Phycisphaerae bacterium]